MKFNRYFTKENKNAYDMFEWEKRNAVITNSSGKIIFEQKDVLFPKTWSDTAVNITSSKYFYGNEWEECRENSLKQLVDRVIYKISEWGDTSGYFDINEDKINFEEELKYLVVSQRFAFNSPVWFNIGTKNKQVSSACYINNLEDSMESILDLVNKEGRIFQAGSGSGINVSTLRSKDEPIGDSGKSSGPISFMKLFNSTAQVVKSGGKSRRAATLRALNVDHPDIEEFIWCKAKEEKKAKSLISNGFDVIDAYETVSFQNANHSIRLDDDFMNAVINDDYYDTKFIKSGKIAKKYKAKSIFRQIAEAAWECGDPGLQFDSITSEYNTCKTSGRINTTNPCGEYSFLNNTACTLGSINLSKYVIKGDILLDDFEHTVKIATTALDILVGNSEYPVEEIAKTNIKYRTIGLGFSELGTIIMMAGFPYDSDEGRNLARKITSYLTGFAFNQSAEISKHLGSFSEYEKNKESVLDVISKYKNIASESCIETVDLWESILTNAKEYGIRNAEISCLAPTGTIGLMMDCATFGIEPELALVKYKKLIDGSGGIIKFVNSNVSECLKNLGYKQKQIISIIKHIEENGTVEGSEILQEHLPIFDCSFKPEKGFRFIQPIGHVKMMEAVQSFISMSISKTCNLPEDATVEDIENIFLEAWKRKLKGITIYRDNCKNMQPLDVTKEKKKPGRKPSRNKLPDTRQSLTHKFSIAGYEGYITCGLYADRTPGEIFILCNKVGSIVSGLLDAFATSLSMSLQYGVPLELIISKHINARYEPSGITNNPDIRFAKSITDYLARWLALTFLNEKKCKELGVINGNGLKSEYSVINIIEESTDDITPDIKKNSGDVIVCPNCGEIAIKRGTCFSCDNCSWSSGCSG